MKFKEKDRIKIIKLSDSDPKCLLYKTGEVIDIIKDDLNWNSKKKIG